MNANETDGVANGGQIVVMVDGGTLSLSASSCNTTVACTSFTHSGDGTNTVTVTAATDGDGNLGEALTLLFTFTPPSVTAPTTIHVAACQTLAPCGPPSTVFATITVLPAGATIIHLVVAIVASPNVLPCSGGTTLLTAVGMDSTGAAVSGVGFVFSTTAGRLVQTSPNTATLTLGPGLGTTATVTATTVDPIDGHISTGTVTVLTECNDFVSVVVTASPNVVACGGSSLITATVRDKNGHVVRGVGFHFTTDNGSLLVGPPNTAEAEQGSAILTLAPPGSSGGIATDTATVRVSVGTTLGTIEGQVTVQQFCQSSSQTAGTISLRASDPNPVCGSSIFIAATLRDVSGNPIPDGETVNFLATSGKVTPATTTTKGATLNVVYTADATAVGSVVITAASGASFGSITLQVSCGGITVAGRAGGITPPSTGDAGLLAR